jgi:hypothetical protein
MADQTFFQAGISQLLQRKKIDLKIRASVQTQS